MERGQIDAVNHRVLTQARLTPFGRAEQDQELGRLQGSMGDARDLGNDRVDESLVVPVVLDDKSGTYLGPAARGEGKIHQNDIAAADVHGCFRGSRSL